MLNIAVLLFDNIELLDFAGPIEVFTTANRIATEAPFEVFTVSDKGSPITSRAGLKCAADYGFESHPRIDILIVPGGDVSAVLEQASLLQWIFAQSKQTNITASVCTGALLLAKAGLLDGLSATTHWEDLELLQQYPSINVISDRRWVDNGQTITSGGIAAGIDMSFHIVSRLTGEPLARDTAKQMEYPYPDRATSTSNWEIP